MKNTLRTFIQQYWKGNPFCPDPKWLILKKLMNNIRAWNLTQGDYLEFGVYQGRSFSYAYQHAQRHNLNLNFYAFDSFEGLPGAVTDSEKDYSHFKSGDYACSESQFKKNLRRNNVDLNNVTVVKGYYNETLSDDLKSKLNLSHPSIIWIDCDLYESTVPVLNFITDLIKTGTFLVFDDWFSFGADPNAGEMRATQEWLTENPHINLIEYRKFGTSGISFLVQNLNSP